MKLEDIDGLGDKIACMIMKEGLIMVHNQTGKMSWEGPAAKRIEAEICNWVNDGGQSDSGRSEAGETKTSGR